MKHRGRHRRRRRGRALRAALAGTALALTAAATMISASQADVADNPGALKPLTRSTETAPLRLTEHPVPRASLDRLSEGMGRPVGVESVLADTDGALRAARACPAEDRRRLPVEPAATRAYCWDAADTGGLRPGAVTASGDAHDAGRRGTHRVILSGWSPGTTDGPARVAFVDADDPGDLRYAWALLAVPVDGGRDYRGLASDVSGMVRYQDKLLVTAGRGDGSALYVYDLDRVQRATVSRPEVGRVPGGWSAAGARFVLPAVASYRPAGADFPHPAGLSLDRGTTPAGLVAHDSVTGDDDRPTRLWRYAFSIDPARSGLLATDPSGLAEPLAVYETKLTDVHGVLAHGPAWYLGRTVGAPDQHGTLWRQDTDGSLPVRCGADGTHRCWSGQTASMSHVPETGEVWSQSGRMLFVLPLTSIDRALG
ncbi:hypothetical protein ACFYOV_09315 [Streptomyces sp. NPDC005931]|uniref:hypothetical protein n=1 Tax=Streptomyces sp. NPDC005931 TaxID=3364737 RepID=UPI00369373D0